MQGCLICNDCSWQVRNCYLVGLNDLAGGKDYVQEKIAGYLQDCVDLGVVGFRIDASKHMWPDDIKVNNEETTDQTTIYVIARARSTGLATYRLAADPFLCTR